ncbi:MAG TPA: hypothetical protein VFP61_01945 [Acidimicrobiales bacterium]|nr:hypothetical protein [Acidimicrobiales bacterium]
MSMADEPVTGRSATVVTRIRGGDLPGEVQVEVRGGTEVWIAYADDEIPRGERVLVVVERGPRAVVVVPYPSTSAPT